MTGALSHVVEAQLARRELLAAVLALVIVAGENAAAVELDRLLVRYKYVSRKR